MDDSIIVDIVCLENGIGASVRQLVHAILKLRETGGR